MTERKKSRPTALGAILPGVLKERGLEKRIEQASIVPEWASLVGPQIGQVTQPMSITRAGVLFVAVTTNAWMNELSMLEPELLKAINGKPGRAAVKKIRWQLRRDDPAT